MSRCFLCGGSGQHGGPGLATTRSTTCEDCGGTGEVEEEEVIREFVERITGYDSLEISQSIVLQDGPTKLYISRSDKNRVEVELRAEGREVVCWDVIVSDKEIAALADLFAMSKDTLRGDHELARDDASYNGSL